MYLFERLKKAFLGDTLYSMERRNQVWSSNKALADKKEVKLSFNAVPNQAPGYMDGWWGVASWEDVNSSKFQVKGLFHKSQEYSGIQAALLQGPPAK